MFRLKNIIRIVLFTIIVVTLISINISAEELNTRDIPKTNDIILQQLQKLNLGDLQEEVNRVNDRVDSFLPKINLQQMIIGFMNGELEFSWAELTRTLLRYLGKEVTANFSLLGQIIVLAVISAVLSIFHQSFSSKTISNTANILIFLVISILILQAFQVAIQIGVDAIDNMVSFMQALLPILLSLLVSTGALTSAAIFHPLTLVIITALSTAIKLIIFPMIFLSVVLNIVTRINQDFSLSRLASLFKEISMSMLGLFLCYL